MAVCSGLDGGARLPPGGAPASSTARGGAPRPLEQREPHGQLQQPRRARRAPGGQTALDYYVKIIKTI